MVETKTLYQREGLEMKAGFTTYTINCQGHGFFDDFAGQTPNFILIDHGISSTPSGHTTNPPSLPFALHFKRRQRHSLSAAASCQCSHSQLDSGCKKKHPLARIRWPRAYSGDGLYFIREASWVWQGDRVGVSPRP